MIRFLKIFGAILLLWLVLSHSLIFGDSFGMFGDFGPNTANLLYTLTENFDQTLSSSATTVQSALEHLDEFAASTGVVASTYLKLDGTNAMTGALETEHGSILADENVSGVLTLGNVGGTYQGTITFDFDEQWAAPLISTTTTGDSDTVKWATHNAMTDGYEQRFGTGADVKMVYETEGNDNFQIGIKANAEGETGYFSIMERLSLGHANRSPSGNSTNPVLRVYSADESSATDYIEMYHDQNKALIRGDQIYINSDGAGKSIVLSPDSGKVVIQDNNTTTFNLYGETDSWDQCVIAPEDACGNQVVIATDGVAESDFDHATTTNPTLFIHSDTDPDTDNTEYGSMAHSGTGSGDGSFDVRSGTGVISLGGVDGSNNEDLTLDFETNSNQVNINSTTSANPTLYRKVRMTDDVSLSFGNGEDAYMEWSGADTIDSLQMGLLVGNNAYSGYFSIMERADMNINNREPAANTANPTLRIYSSDEDQANDYIEMYHDQSSANIDVGDGHLYIDIAAGAIAIDPSTGQFVFQHDGTNMLNFRNSSETDQVTFQVEDDAGNQIIIASDNVGLKDFDHAVQTNPTLFIHSDLDPDTSNIQYGGMFHTGDADDDGGFGLISGTNYITVMNAGDQADDDRIPNAAATNPTLRVYSADDTEATDYIEMYHDQANSHIKSAGGGLYFHAANALYPFLAVNDSSAFYFFPDSNAVQANLVTSDGVGNQVNLVNDGEWWNDFAHALQTNPTLFIHSDTVPSSQTDEWMSLSHDKTNGVIDVGSGIVSIPDGVTIATAFTATGLVGDADHTADSITHTSILDADQADTKCIWLEDPTLADDLESIWANKTANDFQITEIWGESDQTVTFDLQVDDGSPADCDSDPLAPAAGEAEVTDIDGDCLVAAGEELDLTITSTSGTPTWVSICWTGNWVD